MPVSGVNQFHPSGPLHIFLHGSYSVYILLKFKFSFPQMKALLSVLIFIPPPRVPVNIASIEPGSAGRAYLLATTKNYGTKIYCKPYLNRRPYGSQ